MTRLLVLVSISLFLIVACTPTTQPGAEPVFYMGEKDAVFAAVLEAVSTAPSDLGIFLPGPWLITQSDSAGGVVTAQRVSVNLYGQRSVGAQVTAIVASAGDGRSQVVIQLMRNNLSRELAERITSILDQRFGRA